MMFPQPHDRRIWTPPKKKIIHRAMPGHGHSLGVGGRAGKKRIVDSSFPASLSLTGWWRASYSGSPWVGTASAGSSGSRDLTEATNPPATGSALNGLTPADFDGVNDLLTNATTLTDYITASAYFGWVLFNADTVSGGSAFNGPNIIADTGGFWGVAVFDLGGTPTVGPWHWDGGAKNALATISTGAWNLACWRYDGVDIRLKLNSGSIVTTAAGSVSTLTGTMEVGNGFSAIFIDGRVAEIGLMASAGTDALFDDIRSYVNTRYALSL